MQTGKTALICAAGFGRTDCARLLLDAGADINAKSVKVRRVDPPRLRAGHVCVCLGQFLMSDRFCGRMVLLL